MTLAPATERGRLHPTYYRDVDLIFLKTRIERPIPHTINIHSHIFLGVDASGILSRVGILAAPGLWTTRTDAAEVRQAPPADVLLTPAVLAHGPFLDPDTAVHIVADPARTRAVIFCGYREAVDQAVEIGPGCQALLYEGTLAGFSVPLSPRPRVRSAPAESVDPPPFVLPPFGPASILL